MKDMYERSSWSWNVAEKQAELTEETAWYLIASCNDKFLGFSHFRFDVDNGDVVLYWYVSLIWRIMHVLKITLDIMDEIKYMHIYVYSYELQLEPSVRRKGLGRFMMSALESMAYRNQMLKVVLTVFKHNPSAIQFFYALG